MLALSVVTALLVVVGQDPPAAATPQTKLDAKGPAAARRHQSFRLAVFSPVALSTAQGRNTIFGFVFDPSRRPVERANVELLDEVDGLVARARTDGSGRYAFNNLRTGTYQIKVQPLGTGYETQTRRVTITTMSSQFGSQSLQEDFMLRPDRRARASAGGASPGTLFAQNVPEPARRLYEQAVKDLDEKKAESGIEGLKKAIEIFPAYYYALERLGTEYVRNKQYEPAVGYLAKAVEVNPRGYMSLYSLGIARYNLKRVKEAVESLRQAVEIAPTDVNSNMWLGIVLFKDGSLEQAETHLKKAYQLGGKGVPDVHMYLAQIYSNTKRYREAAEELELYLKEAPDLRDKEKIAQLIKQLRDKAR